MGAQDRDDRKKDREELSKEREERRKNREQSRLQQESKMILLYSVNSAEFKREQILEWLSPGPFFKTHEELQRKRVANTGQWFINDTQFDAWMSGRASRMLVCQGIGTMFTINFAEFPSRMRQISFDVEFRV